MTVSSAVLPFHKYHSQGEREQPTERLTTGDIAAQPVREGVPPKRVGI